jgi:hypothetical protein
MHTNPVRSETWKIFKNDKLSTKFAQTLELQKTTESARKKSIANAQPGRECQTSKQSKTRNSARYAWRVLQMARRPHFDDATNEQTSTRKIDG